MSHDTRRKENAALTIALARLWGPKVKEMARSEKAATLDLIGCDPFEDGVGGALEHLRCLLGDDHDKEAVNGAFLEILGITQADLDAKVREVKREFPREFPEEQDSPLNLPDPEKTESNTHLEPYSSEPVLFPLSDTKYPVWQGKLLARPVDTRDAYRDAVTVEEKREILRTVQDYFEEIPPVFWLWFFLKGEEFDEAIRILNG